MLTRAWLLISTKALITMSNGTGTLPFRPATGAEAGKENQQPDWFPRGNFDVAFNNILSTNDPGEW